MIDLNIIASENDEITIQCHDNPDADAIGSGFALYRFFVKKGIKTSLIYSGKNKIGKVNLKKMVELLHIPIEFVKPNIDVDGLLITVDCQYGCSNVTNINCKKCLVIDHHIPDPYRKPNNGECIRSLYGSCSTVIYHLLVRSNYLIKDDLEASTGLYYGLYMDTGEFSEITNMADKDARDELHFNLQIITILQNSNLTFSDFSIAGQALSNYHYFPDRRIATIQTQPCDVNILGFISDLLLRVDGVDVGIVYTDLGDITKLSIRSCSNEIKANELAQYITLNIGGGGGHIRKSGGYISNLMYKEQFASMCKSKDEYIYKKFCSFYDSFDYVYTDKYKVDVSEFKLFTKCELVLGWIPSTTIAPLGTQIILRTQEGDVSERVSDNLIIMVGILGEVYPIKRTSFEKKYKVVDEPFDIDFEYSPRIRVLDYDDVVFLEGLIKPCKVLPANNVYAKKLSKETKIFSEWNYENYMTGRIGDYIVCYQKENGEPNSSDLYIVNGNIFNRLYTKVRP
ncbi:MAG: bifunctional oligoribonuclease/PAP phosphatase NrnA [Succinivibrionaceae bacterium]